MYISYVLVRQEAGGDCFFWMWYVAVYIMCENVSQFRDRVSHICLCVCFYGGLFLLRIQSESGIGLAHHTRRVIRRDRSERPRQWSHLCGCGHIWVPGRVVIPTLSQVAVQFVWGSFLLSSNQSIGWNDEGGEVYYLVNSGKELFYCFPSLVFPAHRPVGGTGRISHLFPSLFHQCFYRFDMAADGIAVGILLIPMHGWKFHWWWCY